MANGELYFAYSAAPAGAVLTGWLLAEVRPARWAGAMLFAGAAYGALLGAVLFRYGPGREVGPWPVLWRHLLGEPVIALVEVILVGVLGWWALRARWPVLAGSGLAVLVAASVGLGVDTTVRSTSAGIRSVVAGRLPSAGTKRSFWVTAQEMRAAEWVASNAPPRDVVATNVHCELVRTTKTCISRSFWVSAVSEHAVALEGWAYQDSVMARHGVNGLPYFRQPAPDRARPRPAAHQRRRVHRAHRDWAGHAARQVRRPLALRRPPSRARLGAAVQAGGPPLPVRAGHHLPAAGLTPPTPAEYVSASPPDGTPRRSSPHLAFAVVPSCPWRLWTSPRVRGLLTVVLRLSTAARWVR